MASTITLSGSVGWAQPFLRFPSLTIGTGNEPAISAANLVKQTILGPPFSWRWNRATATFATVQGTQDYSVAISDFGFLEGGSVAAGGVTVAIANVRTRLSEATPQGRPSLIATQVDDNAGNITFRLSPVPDKVYTVKATYQKKATLFAATSDTWAPIPDECSYIFNSGFLGMMLTYWDDGRYAFETNRFLTALLGASEGLNETQKNLFLNQWVITHQQAATVRPERPV